MLFGRMKTFFTTVRKRKLRLYEHIKRSTGLAKMILQGTVQGRRKEKQTRKIRMDKITVR